MENKDSRRNFLKNTLVFGLGGGAISLIAACNGEEDPQNKGPMVKVLTTDGKVVEIPASSINKHEHVTPEASRKGIPGRSFVMVIDLAKCKNARACVEKCQKAHDLGMNEEYMKVQLLRDNAEGAPYWFPKPCYHCDEPPCVTVCPTGATFKRDDNIVLVDNERCIGCKFCMSSCPYSARIFNWNPESHMERSDVEFSPETSVPRVSGTVMKCDFCPDMIREGKLPHCVSGCPMGVIYFGDENEDIVTNGEESLQFSKLIMDRAGYRHLEHLGTKPNVYYLPAVDRQFPLDRGFDDEKILKRYKDVPEVREYLNENKG
jgi:Fe-S-cluster-containing dehydrogenase component